MVVKGKTKSGFEFKVDSEMLEDAEFLEILADMQSDEPIAVFKFARKVLGKEQKQKFYDHHRNKKGIVSQQKVTAELVEILEALTSANATKN